MIQLLIVVGITFLVLTASRIELNLQMRAQAKRSYARSRGTRHLRTISSCLPRLQRTIKEVESKIQHLEAENRKLTVAKQRELEGTLTTHLVNGELDQIPGIGIELQDRVLKQCFNGTLESLYQAPFVYGVGENRGWAILCWVKETYMRLPELLAKDFPGKTDLVVKYRGREERIQHDLRVNQEKLRELLQLERTAITTRTAWGTVSPSTFFDAYRGKKEATKAVTNYMIGVYPEWGRMPVWYKTLTETIGPA
jgi:hypothetical protein